MVEVTGNTQVTLCILGQVPKTHKMSQMLDMNQMLFHQLQNKGLPAWVLGCLS